MNKKKLRAFFEEQDFRVHLSNEGKRKYAEIETWTNGGVNMIIMLEPFTKEAFIERVKEFDMDEEIDLYRQDQRYKNDFTITQSVKDFTEFQERLEGVVEKLEAAK